MNKDQKLAFGSVLLNLIMLMIIGFMYSDFIQETNTIKSDFSEKLKKCNAQHQMTQDVLNDIKIQLDKCNNSNEECIDKEKKLKLCNEENDLLVNVVTTDTRKECVTAFKTMSMLKHLINL